jgi:hypothetical protein
VVLAVGSSARLPEIVSDAGPDAIVVVSDDAMEVELAVGSIDGATASATVLDVVGAAGATLNAASSVFSRKRSTEMLPPFARRPNAPSVTDALKPQLVTRAPSTEMLAVAPRRITVTV